MSIMQARPTIYRGVQMRSRLEARVAAWFDQHRLPWAYEPVCFADRLGQYLPDFELRDLGVAGRAKRPVYVEVKPTWEHADQWRHRMQIIWSSIPEADLLVIAPGYLDFAFGDYLPVEPVNWPRSVRTWQGDWGGWRPDPAQLPAEAGRFHRCTQCREVTLTITIDAHACARCGAWNGDRHLHGTPAPDRIPLEVHA